MTPARAIEFWGENAPCPLDHDVTITYHRHERFGAKMWAVAARSFGYTVGCNYEGAYSIPGHIAHSHLPNPIISPGKSPVMCGPSGTAESVNWLE